MALFIVGTAVCQDCNKETLIMLSSIDKGIMRGICSNCIHIIKLTNLTDLQVVSGDNEKVKRIMDVIEFARKKEERSK